MPVSLPAQPSAETQKHAPRWLDSPLFIPLALLGMTLVMFANVLFLPGDQVPSGQETDLSSMFVYWRQFGFGEMQAGHIALWNPHVFAGVPFLGNPQPALFYGDVLKAVEI